MSTSHLVERAAELSLIDAALERSRAGSGAFVLVEGPAGVGKSTLLAAAAARAHQAGTEVLRARGGQYERGLPFEVARQLLERPLTRDPARRERALVGAALPAGRLVGADGPAAEQATPLEARHALYWLVANLADETPLVLVVDDLQWADPSSQQWLLYLARRVADLPVAIIASWRTGEGLEDLLDQLSDEDVTERARPQPLSVAAVADVVHAALDPGAGGPVCEAAHRVTAGNPFLLHELLRAVDGTSPQTAADIDRARPESVARGITRRMAGMPPGSRALADAVAILGDGCELRHAGSLAGLDTVEAVTAADELARAAILAAERPLRFEHPLVRSALHDAQPLNARDQAHLDAARILAAEGEPVTRIASHLLSAPALADPWTAEQLETAGRLALWGGAPAEAADLLARALAEPPPAHRRAALLLALGQAENNAGHRLARTHLEEALALAADPAVRAEAAWALAVACGLDGDMAGLEATLLGVLDDGARSDPEQRLPLLAFLGNGLWMGYSDSDVVREAIERDAGGLPGATHGECLLLSVAAMYRLITDPTPDRAIELAQRSLRDGLLFAGELDAPPLGSALLTLLAADRLVDARAAIEAGLAEADRRGSLTGRFIFSYLRCSAGWLSGDLAESETDGRTALAVARQSSVMSPIATPYLARTLVDRGLLDEAAALMTEEAPGPFAGNVHWSVLAHVREAQGRHDEAAQAALALADVPVAQGTMSCAIPWRLQAAVALAAAGDQASARELLAQQRPVTERCGLPRATAALQRAEGLVEGSTELLECAAGTLDGTPARLEHARTLIDLGAMRRRANNRAEGREALRAGLDKAQRCGAGALVAHAIEELAACGARPRNVLLTGVDSLTPSERRVARLAAEGRNNPEIAQSLYVSRKTVEKHLGAIYRKLDISSRTALADALANT